MFKMLKYKDVYNLIKTAADLKAPVATATYPKVGKTNKSLMQTIFGGNGFRKAFGVVPNNPLKAYDPYSLVQDLKKYDFVPFYNGTYKVTSSAQLARKNRIAEMSAALKHRMRSMFGGSRSVKSIPSSQQQFIQSPIK